MVARAPLFEEALLSATIHQDEITRARSEQPLLADLETQLLNLLRNAEGASPAIDYAPEDESPSTPKPAARSGHPILVPAAGADAAGRAIVYGGNAVAVHMGGVTHPRLYAEFRCLSQLISVRLDNVLDQFMIVRY